MAKFGYYISEALHQQGLLHSFVVHSKGKFTTGFPSQPVSPLSRYYLRALQTVNDVVKLPNHKMRFLQEWLFDRFCAKRLDSSIGVLVATQPFLKHTFRKAKKMGITIVFIPGTMEENTINRIVLEEQKIMNMQGEDAYTHPPRLKYYNDSIKLVDIVAAPFSVVYTSYSASEYTGKIVALYGYLKPEIPTGSKDASDPVFRVGYLAHTVLLKGLQYLLEAWKKLSEEGKLQPDMELHIAGGMDNDMLTYVDQHYKGLKGVHIKGHTSQVSQFYQSLDLFVVPSLTDGTPYTAIEAAMNGVPVIVTENCGAVYFLNTGKEEGCITLPIRDTQGIADQIMMAYTQRDTYRTIGEMGRLQVTEYDAGRYVHEMVDYLTTLIPKS